MSNRSDPIERAALAVQESRRTPGVYHALKDPEMSDATICGAAVREDDMRPLEGLHLCGNCEASLIAKGRLAQ